MKMALLVNEIFYSIQGESSYAGLPCVLVRLAGCNLRCTYCDTKYAYGEGSAMNIPEIIGRVRGYNCRLVEITGGEPLIQTDTPALISGLIDMGLTVLLETNGSVDISAVDGRCIRVLDIKCPSSGEAEKNDFGNLSVLTHEDEIKFVVGDRADYEYAKWVMSEFAGVLGSLKPPIISPVFGKIDLKSLAAWILNDRLRARLQVQLHKIIWGPDLRGV